MKSRFSGTLATRRGSWRAVVGRNFDARPEAAKMADTGDLKRDLEGWCGRYEALLRENLLLVRTCIGEIHRHELYEGRVLHAIFAPLRSALVDRLHAAAQKGGDLFRRRSRDRGRPLERL